MGRRAAIQRWRRTANAKIHIGSLQSIASGWFEENDEFSLFFKIAQVENIQRGKELNKFCPPKQQRLPLPFLLYLSFFYDPQHQNTNQSIIKLYATNSLRNLADWMRILSKYLSSSVAIRIRYLQIRIRICSAVCLCFSTYFPSRVANPHSVHANSNPFFLLVDRIWIQGFLWIIYNNLMFQQAIVNFVSLIHFKKTIVQDFRKSCNAVNLFQVVLGHFSFYFSSVIRKSDLDLEFFEHFNYSVKIGQFSKLHFTFTFFSNNLNIFHQLCSVFKVPPCSLNHLKQPVLKDAQIWAWYVHYNNGTVRT